VKLHQFEPSVAVRGLQHRDLRPNALKPHHAVHPIAFGRPFTLQLESELDEECRRGRQVVDHDAHVLHALDRHALDGSDATAPANLIHQQFQTPDFRQSRKHPSIGTPACSSECF
jgi:hypothetical protein